MMTALHQPESDVVHENLAVFYCDDDKEGWKTVNPTSYGDPTNQDTKRYLDLEKWIKKKFGNDHQVKFCLKFMQRCLLRNERREDLDRLTVNVQLFILMTKWFGSFAMTGSSCIFLEQIKKLKSFSRKVNCQEVSPFAGIMKKETAKGHLETDAYPIGSYFIFIIDSASGDYCLAVKDKDGKARTYNIEGAQEQAMEHAGHYNARLKLQHTESPNLNDTEGAYNDIVELMQRRLTRPIEDGVLCSQVCPKLAYNALMIQYK